MSITEFGADVKKDVPTHLEESAVTKAIASAPAAHPVMAKAADHPALKVAAASHPAVAALVATHPGVQAAAPHVSGAAAAHADAQGGPAHPAVAANHPAVEAAIKAPGCRGGDRLAPARRCAQPRPRAPRRRSRREARLVASRRSPLPSRPRLALVPRLGLGWRRLRERRRSVRVVAVALGRVASRGSGSAPLVGSHPFLVVGRAGCLRRLRRERSLCRRPGTPGHRSLRWRRPDSGR